MFKRLNTILKEKAGITIVETLVSLLILSFGLIPALSVLTSSAHISNKIRNNLVAANLAQEGIEVTRGLRDANWFLDKTNFYDDIVGTWEVSFDSSWANPPSMLVSISAARSLKYDPVSGLYNYTTGQETPFKRAITVTLSPNPCNCELIITSSVFWVERGMTKNVQAEIHLYDWK